MTNRHTLATAHSNLIPLSWFFLNVNFFQPICTNIYAKYVKRVLPSSKYGFCIFIQPLFSLFYCFCFADKTWHDLVRHVQNVRPTPLKADFCTCKCFPVHQYDSHSQSFVYCRVFVLLIIDYSTKKDIQVYSWKRASEIVCFRSNPYRMC